MIAKAFGPRVKPKRFIELLAFSKIHMAAIIGVLTVHCSIGTHAEAENFGGLNLSDLQG